MCGGSGVRRRQRVLREAATRVGLQRSRVAKDFMATSTSTRPSSGGQSIAAGGGSEPEFLLRQGKGGEVVVRGGMAPGGGYL